MREYKIFNMCNIFLVLLLLNDVTGFFFTNASIGSRFVFYSIIAISFYYWMKVVFLVEEMPRLLKGWSILLLLFTLYGIPLIVSGKMFIIKENFRHIGGGEFLKLIYYSMLPLFPIYEFTRKGELTVDKLKILCILLLITSTFQFNEYHIKMLLLTKAKGLSVKEFTNNTGYLFLQILPLTIFFRKQKVIMTSLIIYCIYMIVIGMKRGAIVLSVPCLILLLLELYKSSTRRQKILIVFISIVLVVFSVGLIQYMLENSNYFNTRLQATMSGDSSHRDTIYFQAINVFLGENNIIMKFFGHGGYSTLDLMMNNAHNDWLEILVNHGIIGVLVFMNVCFQMCYTTKQAQKYDSSLYISMLTITIIFIGRTILSMAYSDMGHGLIIAMGYGIAQLKLQQESENLYSN